MVQNHGVCDMSLIIMDRVKKKCAVSRRRNRQFWRRNQGLLGPLRAGAKQRILGPSGPGKKVFFRGLQSQSGEKDFEPMELKLFVINLGF